MAAQHKYEPDQVVGNFTVVERAPARHGHARWTVECRTCGDVKTVRATDIASRLKCSCTSSAQAADTSVLAAIAALTDEVRTLRSLVEKLQQPISVAVEPVMLIDTVELAQPVEPPKTGGIKNYSMRSPQPAVEPRPEPEYQQMTASDVIKGAGAITPAEQRAALEASWARAWELARKTDRTPEETRELHERRNVERDTREGYEMDPERLAARRQEFNDQRMCLDRRGPYQPPLED